MRIELEVAGYEVNFVSINKDNAVDTQEEIIKHCSFPQLQDTEELGLWDRMGGGKDDFYIFDAEGVLQTYFRFYGPIGTTLSEPDDYQTVKQAMISVLDGKITNPEPEPGRDAGSEPETTEDEVTAPLPDADSPVDVGPAPDDVSPESDTVEGDVSDLSDGTVDAP